MICSNAVDRGHPEGLAVYACRCSGPSIREKVDNMREASECVVMTNSTLKYGKFPLNFPYFPLSPAFVLKSESKDRLRAYPESLLFFAIFSRNPSFTRPSKSLLTVFSVTPKEETSPFAVNMLRWLVHIELHDTGLTFIDAFDVPEFKQ